MNRSLNSVNKTKSKGFQVRKQTKTKKKLLLRKQTKYHVRNTEQKLLLLIIKRSVDI